jgi:ferredoxin--NADP+ reductase/benzoate/toluate 1,2-dioxygenase reductase subunit
MSRYEDGDYHGRVTGWLRSHPVDSDTRVYLCGNCDMIYEVYDILGSQGVGADRIHAEVYF